MKIKQPNYRCPVDCAADDAEIDVEIPTASLLAELEKRRPQCHYSTCKNMGSEVCGGCLWNTCMGEKLTDNFKPAK